MTLLRRTQKLWTDTRSYVTITHYVTVDGHTVGMVTWTLTDVDRPHVADTEHGTAATWEHAKRAAWKAHASHRAVYSL